MNIVLNCDCMAFTRAQKECFTIQGKKWNFKDVLAIVDPPYFDGPNKGCFYGGGKSKIYKEKYNNIKSWMFPNKNYYYDLLRISKNQIIWGINYYDFPVGPGRVIWDKDNRNSSFSDCEIAFISHMNSTRLFKYTWDGFRQGNGKNKEKRIHPTQKPVALYKWLLKNYATPGQLIFDSHLGSGSLRIACHDMGFDFVGCELDYDYWKAQEERYKNHIANQELIPPEEIQKAIWEQGIME